MLTVASITTSIDFYTAILSMQKIEFSNGRKALQFGTSKINLHQKGEEFHPCAEKPTAGSEDLCFIVETPIKEVLNILKLKNLSV